MASETKSSPAVVAKSAGTGAVIHVVSEEEYKTKRAAAGSDTLVIVDFSAEWSRHFLFFDTSLVYTCVYVCVCVR
jgi:hypothetical protein